MRLNNPTMQKMIDAMEEKVPSSARKAYDAIITNGLRIMFGPETRKDIMKGVSGKAAHAKGAMIVLSVMRIIEKEYGQKLPKEAIQAATAGLLLNMLDWLEMAGQVKLTPDKIKQAVEVVQKMGALANQGDELKAQEAQQAQPQPQPQQQEQPGILQGAMA